MVAEPRHVDPKSHGAVTEDALLGGRLRLRQPASGFRAAIDPLMLAAAAPARPGERVIDLGCGVGTAGLALLARVGELRVTALDVDPAMVALARDNAALNGWAERFEAVEGDVVAPDRLPSGFDLALCNPPFVEAGTGTRSGHAGRDRAMQEGEAALADWARAALAALRPKGTACFVHRADRLEALLAALAGRAGAIEVYPLWPAPAERGRAAKRVIVRARKGLRSPTRLWPGLVLHGPDGGYTPEAEAVLRDAAALPIREPA